jgi:uncharacterized protein YndB with AHSA1/START domain
MHIEYTIDIAAPPERVWEIITDIERWPEWTGTTNSAVLHGDFGVGATATLDIDGTPPGKWKITEVDPGRSFSWVARARGVRTVAGHFIESRPHGSEVRLTLDFTGIPSLIFRLLIKRVAVRNIEKEAQGLKRAAEAIAPVASSAGAA